MSLLVEKPGLLDTVQDAGRFGYAQLGIQASGAADPLALAVANFLVGNPANSAVLECHFPAPVLRFEKAGLFALSGADFGPELDGEPLVMHRPLWAPAGAVLIFKKIRDGARCYLAVRGGFDLPVWLGSRSTNRAAGAGGFEGRALQAGDRLAWVGTEHSEAPGRPTFPWSANVRRLYGSASTLRFCPGPEYRLLDDFSKKLLENSDWLVAPQSDRMGCQLQGPFLKTIPGAELVSTAVTAGTIQLFPFGNPVVLLADGQTTGGYPRIGQVIRADLPRLAQLPAGCRFWLRAVDLATAFEALRQQDAALRQLRWSCTLRLERAFSRHW